LVKIAFLFSGSTPERPRALLTIFLIWGSGTDSGPWIMADFEGGVFSGGTTLIKNNPACPAITFKYVSATLKNSSTTYTLKYGDAQSGTLKTIWDGDAPENQIICIYAK
jgi:hypothetical protein